MALSTVISIVLSAAAIASAAPITGDRAPEVVVESVSENTLDGGDFVGGNKPCTWGPSYWCASNENAAECGLEVDECQKYCNNNDAYPELQNGTLCSTLTPIVGNNNCTWGPSFWCQSRENAALCNVSTAECFKYCDTNVSESLSFNISDSDICNPLGQNPCTWGPSFWCSSFANADRCNFTTDECEKYCNNTEEYTTLTNSPICEPIISTLVGTNSCTNGPSFWCASEANVLSCNMTVEACDKYCEDEERFTLQNSTLCHPELL
eukprot:comp25251_c0_seq1/m.46977 comp25251_c0_seq1/g.46977  ORF comp25251_c0_seq1/g.46977 comp25251_c0_seq1/m.46977 type:complete len:265 (-) comp25251_c0_seq1:206-1000(-)